MNKDMADTIRILVIDDEAAIRSLAITVLRQEFPNLHPVEAANALELSQALEGPGFDFVITDYRLGWSNGIEVLRAVKRRWPDCPVIMVTGSSNEEIAVEAMKAGLDDYVTKSPSHFARLTAAARSVLERARERKERTAQLRLHTAALQAAANGIILTEPDGTISWVNPAFTAMTGYGPEEVIGKNPRLLRSGKQDPSFYADLWRTISSGSVWAGELINRRKDGTLYHEEMTITPVRDADGAIRNYIAIKQDITERKQAHEALTETLDMLRAAIHASPVAIAILETDGRVRMWNPAAERIFGWREEEVLGRPLPTIPPGKEEEHRAFRARVLADNAFTGIEVVRLRKDGAPVDISLSTAPLRNAQGRIWGIMGLMNDITERKMVEMQAKRTERLAALGQLLGGIAHELKNPLFVVTGRLQLMKEKLAGREYDALADDIQRVEEAARRMSTTTQRFLALSRPTEPHWGQCSIRAVLDSLLEFLGNELMKNRIRVVTSFAPDLPETWTESQQLQEVFLNLLLNAVQAMTAAQGKGTLTVATALEEGWIVVRIQDDGPGIVPEHMAKVFEPFFTTKQPGAGTGLGLWTVRTTLATLNGTIDCTSEPGRGAIFAVRIPIVSAPAKT
jgi:PAS domain S-box-containing protein